MKRAPKQSSPQYTPTGKDMRRVAEAVMQLDRPDSATIASLLRMDIAQVERILEDDIFHNLLTLHREGKFMLWAGLIAQEEEALSKIIARLGYDAVLRLKQLIYSEDERVAGAAIRTALEYNSELELPVVRHEITTRFTTEELDKAREIVKKLKHKLPELQVPDGPPN